MARAKRIPFDERGNRSETSVALTALVGPPSKDWAVRLAQIRAAMRGDLVCVGPYTDERYELAAKEVTNG